MRPLKILIPLLLSAAAAFGQQQIDPTSQINWPLATGTGAPTIACTSANYGQPYSNLAPNPAVVYVCTANGWQSASGSGDINPFTQWQEAFGPNAGTSPTVGPISNEYTLPIGQTGSTITSVLSTAGNAIRLQPGDWRQTFSNPDYNPVHDDRTNVPADAWNVTESGAACDAGMLPAVLTAGSTTLTASGAHFTTADTGKWIESVGTVSGVVTRFDATVTYASATTLTLSVPAPFTSASGTYVLFGHQDDAALASAISLGLNTGRTIALPVGTCWSATPQKFGANLVGHGKSWAQFTNSEGVLVSNGSSIAGSAGEDVLALMDPSQSGYVGPPSGFETHDYNILLDPVIDATQPWQICTNGTCVAQTPLYRPGGILDANAPDPMAPQWCQGTGPYKTGCLNGVATVANASTLACIPTSETLPAVGSEIIFPGYAAGTANFETTVASQGGTGCASGTNPITLTAAFTPATPSAPAEWFAGTSLQTIQTAIPATGRTFPMTVTLGNPILPIPPLTQYASPAGFGAWGLVQIDGEQCSYYGNSAIPASSTASPSITLTACAQNGTAAAAHSVGAFIVPMNLLEPTWPWPVTPTLTANQTTPANAEFFPSFGVGNAGIAAPTANGTGISAFYQSIYDAKIYNILVETDWTNGAAGSPVGWTNQNDTAGIYLTQIPFRSTFRDISIGGAMYGLIEGSPATNTAGWFGTYAYPTANGNDWDSIFLRSMAADMHIISDEGGGFKQLSLFSQSTQAPNNTWPGFTPAYSGGIESIVLDSAYNDEQAVYPYASIGVQFDTFDFRYDEIETGQLSQKSFSDQWTCRACSWYNTSPESTGTRIVGGAYQNFSGGTFGGSATLPLINAGWTNTFKDVSQLGNIQNTQAGNVWGVNGFLNWGPAVTANGPGYNVFGTPSGPTLPQATGNSIASPGGQTAETLVGGNLTAPYTNSRAGLITADEFNTNSSLEPNPMSQGWTLDTTEPLVGAYAGCNVGNDDLTTYCNDYALSGGVWIGPGQRLAAGQYVLSLNAKQSTGSAQQFGFRVNTTSCAAAGTQIYSANVPITTSWVNQSLGVVNLSALSGCQVAIQILGTTSTATQIQVADVDFAPVDSTRTVNNLTALGTVTLPFTGSSQCLTVNTSGQVGAATCGAGNVTASGLTANVIPKATGANSLGASSITDNATIVSTTEPIQTGGNTTSVCDKNNPTICDVWGTGAPTGCGTTWGNSSTYHQENGAAGSLFWVCEGSGVPANIGLATTETSTSSSIGVNYLQSDYVITGNSTGGYVPTSCQLYIATGTSGGVVSCGIVAAASGTTQSASYTCSATYTEASATTNAYVTIPLSGCGTLPVSTPYWIALNTNDSALISGLYNCGSSCTGAAGSTTATYYYVASTYGATTLPTTYTGGSSNNLQISAYVIATTASGTWADIK